MIDSTIKTIMKTHFLTKESTRAYKLMNDSEFTTQLICGFCNLGFLNFIVSDFFLIVII